MFFGCFYGTTFDTMTQYFDYIDGSHNYNGEKDVNLLNALYPEYFNRKKKKHTIPHILVMTWKSRNEVPDYVISQWKKFNPKYQLDFYDDERIIDFLHNEYGDKYVKFFNDMVFGRFKADFFRYCYLYKRGGVYADIDLDPKVSIDSFLNDDSTFFSVRIWRQRFIFQAYLASAAYHPILKQAIDKIMEIGPRVGIDPPETSPFGDYHPTRCMYLIIEKLLGREPTTGRWETPYGPLQLALEQKVSKKEDGTGGYHLVAYNNIPIANSRRSSYDQTKGYAVDNNDIEK